MKRVIILTLSIVLMYTSTNAQQQKAQPNATAKHHGKHEQESKLAKVQKHLQLTEEQKTQAKAIAKNFQEKHTLLKANDNITMGNYKKQLANLEQERKTKMLALLTTEQKEKIANHKKQAQENSQVQAAARLERMKIKLDLSTDLLAKIKLLQDKTREKITALKNNETLASLEKKEQVKQLMKGNKESFEAILTDEQKASLKSMGRKRK